MAQEKDTNASQGKFTERETKYMAAACQSFKGDPQLDIEKFASLVGLTAGSARNAWGAIKKKLKTSSESDVNLGEDADNGASAPHAPKKAAAKKTAKTAKRKAVATSEDGEADNDGAAPVKKARGGRKPKAVAQKTVEEDDDDDSAHVPLSFRGKGNGKVKNEPKDEDNEDAQVEEEDPDEV